MSPSYRRIQPIQKNGRARLVVQLNVGENIILNAGGSSGDSGSDGPQAGLISTNNPEPQRRTLIHDIGRQTRRSARRALSEVTRSIDKPAKRQRLGSTQAEKCEACRRQRKECIHIESGSSSIENPVRTTGLGRGKTLPTSQQWVTFPADGSPAVATADHMHKRSRRKKAETRNRIILPAAVIGNPYSHVRTYAAFYAWSTNPHDPKDIDDKMMEVFKKGPITVEEAPFVMNPMERSTPPPHLEGREEEENTATASDRVLDEGMTDDDATKNLENSAGGISNATANDVDATGDANTNDEDILVNKSNNDDQTKRRRYKSYGGYVFEFDSDLESG
ncbi:hypothetical protein K431DRAFT_287070 [Polychaeton citri CBS 116435]|uniref:Uncharacterized protein n=1 Tax=Polychaeton citri CBS 116435 TaxID=1314669 RepID=A0A9P4ULZ4_9PEZI|nr:hypothetical protein K431DRAFT_287070 [Polychaeton citri CBS 116435]